MAPILTGLAIAGRSPECCGVILERRERGVILGRARISIFLLLLVEEEYEGDVVQRIISKSL